MNMDNKQAAQILIPLRDMMIDQHGCPISDAWFALGKAIDALSAQADGDLISRQAAIDAIEKLFSHVGTEYECGKDDGLTIAQYEIEDLPSAQPEQRWIPCSEKLPEKDGEYIICTERGHMHILDYAEGWNCFRNCDGLVMRDNEIHCVIAWYPLPEPYKADMNNSLQNTRLH